MTRAAFGCNEAITPDVAHHVYDRLLALHGADGCALDEVQTDAKQMIVRWKQNDVVLPAAEVMPRPCATPQASLGPALAILVPEPLRAACPTTIVAAIEAVKTDTFGGTTRVDAEPTPWWA